MKQLSFFEDTVFGGEGLKGNPRGARPIETKNALYVSFKTGTENNLNLKNNIIKRIIKKQSKTHKVKIHKSLVSKSSVQLLISVKSQKSYASFIRATTGIIARIILKAERGSAKGVKFWVTRPFSKVISFGKELHLFKKYISSITSKALGFDLKAQSRQELIFHLTGYT